MGKKDEYHFKCAVKRGRSSSGIILHDGFKTFTCNKKYCDILENLKKVFSTWYSSSKIIIIGIYFILNDWFFY